MPLWSTLEYLIYLAIFISYFKLSESISVDFGKSTSTAASAHVDLLTTSNSSVENAGNFSGSNLKRTLAQCNNYFSWMCLKLEFVKFLERLSLRDEVHLVSGIAIVKDPSRPEIKTSKLMAEVARSYPSDPDARLTVYIISKIEGILQTHYLRLSIIDDQTIDMARSLIGTARKDKFVKKGGLEALLAAGLMLKGILVAAGMGGIALMAGKALILALMALTMTTVVGLKSLAGSGGKSHTYEILPKTVFTSSHSQDDTAHGSLIDHSGTAYGGYARTMNLKLPQNIKIK